MVTSHSCTQLISKKYTFNMNRFYLETFANSSLVFIFTFRQMVVLSNLSKPARDETEDKRWKMITNIFDSHGQHRLKLESIIVVLLKFDEISQI